MNKSSPSYFYAELLAFVSVYDQCQFCLPIAKPPWRGLLLHASASAYKTAVVSGQRPQCPLLCHACFLSPCLGNGVPWPRPGPAVRIPRTFPLLLRWQTCSSAAQREGLHSLLSLSLHTYLQSRREREKKKTKKQPFASAVSLGN